MENYDVLLIDDIEGEVDPLYDIIDYLVRCSKISFKNTPLNQTEIRTKEKIKVACKLFRESPTEFLLQYGKFLSPNHLEYFDTLVSTNDASFRECLSQLKIYHSNECRNKRIRNRRYKALQKLQEDTDYFSEKQMMYRNPLLYEQLIGQYLTDEEIRERDNVDNENLTLLNMILETVDRNDMRETKNEQKLVEDIVSDKTAETENDDTDEECDRKHVDKQWGDFEVPDTTPKFKPDKQKQSMINANERNLLREEFLHEMYSSFIEGRDTDFDYNSVDNNEEYDDLEQISRDAEDKYFDSEDNDAETLEEHMKHVDEYGRNKSVDSGSDPLDVFMQHISNKLQV